MRLNDILNNYINQSSVTGKGESISSQQLPVNIGMQIKALTPGQILQGEVVENLGDVVKLLVQLNGEKIPLQARLENNMIPVMGKSMLLQVKNNGSALYLSPLFENMGMEQNAARALEEASLPVNENTLGMTAKLMQEGISIDKNTLQEFYHQILSDTTADLMDIIDLHKLNLPINNENLNQIHSYKVMTHQLSDGLNQMADDLVNMIRDMVQNGNEKDAVMLLRAVLQPQNTEVSEGVNSADNGSKMHINSEEDNLVQNLSDKTILSEKTVVLEAENINPQKLVDTDIQGENKTINQKNNAVAQLVEELELTFLKDSIEDISLKQIIDSKEFAGKISDILQKQYLLMPERVEKEEINQLYTKLSKQLSHISEMLHNISAEQSPLGKTVDNLNSNLNFLNQMNQLYAYIQLPLKLSGNDTHGELYVYSNKKHLTEQEGEVSALLHLDMKNLGPIDIYVRLKEANVSTEFWVGDDALLEFLQEHMELLTERLEKRGYHMTCKMTVKEDKDEGNISNTVFAELLHRNSNVPALVKYSFDVRA